MDSDEIKEGVLDAYTLLWTPPFYVETEGMEDKIFNKDGEMYLVGPTVKGTCSSCIYCFIHATPANDEYIREDNPMAEVTVYCKKYDAELTDIFDTESICGNYEYRAEKLR